MKLPPQNCCMSIREGFFVMLFALSKNTRSQKTFSNQQCQTLVKEIIAPPALEIDALGMRTKNELIIIIPRKPDVF